MLQVILYTVLFDLVSGFSILLTGDRSLISGNLFSRFFEVIFNWKFILAMVLAVLSRFCFIMVNNKLLQVPAFADKSTSLTVVFTTTSYIFIFLLNAIFLHERISLQQLIGSVFVIIGIVIITY